KPSTAPLTLRHQCANLYTNRRPIGYGWWAIGNGIAVQVEGPRLARPQRDDGLQGCAGNIEGIAVAIDEHQRHADRWTNRNARGVNRQCIDHIEARGLPSGDAQHPKREAGRMLATPRAGQGPDAPGGQRAEAPNYSQRCNGYL